MPRDSKVPNGFVTLDGQRLSETQSLVEHEIGVGGVDRREPQNEQGSETGDQPEKAADARWPWGTMTSLGGA